MKLVRPLVSTQSQQLICQALKQFWGDSVDSVETARRIIGYWSEFSPSPEGEESLFKSFDCDNDNLVLECGIPFQSLCEHHLLPFMGVVHIGYIPNGKVLGLSKLGRVTDHYAKRPQLQERLTQQIGESLNKYLNPLGVICIIEAEHTCMSTRGVLKPNTITKTSYVSGILKNDLNARQEALKLIYG